MSEDKKDQANGTGSLEDAIEKLEQEQGTQEAGSSENSAATDLEAELQKAKNEYLYLRADFDNFRKSTVKERSELVKFGSERLVVELLNVLDTFDQALDMDINSENIDSFTKGVQMIRSELNNTLGKFGVKAMDAKGEAFDPTMHEALSAEPSTDIPAGHITQVFKKAYKMHDRVIRPAQVVVATEPEAKEPDTSAPEDNNG